MVIALIFIFLCFHNILFYWGTGPISINKPLSHQTIGIHADQATLYQKAQFLFKPVNIKNSDFSVSSEYFISAGDSPVSVNERTAHSP